MLQDSISAVIAKYSSNGYMDILQEKWYGALPCFKLATDMAQPRPLGVAAVAGLYSVLCVCADLSVCSGSVCWPFSLFRKCVLTFQFVQEVFADFFVCSEGVC